MKCNDQEINVGDAVEIIYEGIVTGVTERTIFVRAQSSGTTVEHIVVPAVKSMSVPDVRVLERALPTEDGLYVETGDEKALILYRRLRGEWSIMSPFYVFPKAADRAQEAHRRRGLVRLVPSDRASAE